MYICRYTYYFESTEDIIQFDEYVYNIGASIALVTGTVSACM